MIVLIGNNRIRLVVWGLARRWPTRASAPLTGWARTQARGRAICAGALSWTLSSYASCRTIRPSTRGSSPCGKVAAMPQPPFLDC